MSLSLLSRNNESQKEILGDIAYAAVQANLRFIINDHKFKNRTIEISIDRNYRDVPVVNSEHFLMDIHTKAIIQSEFEQGLISLRINSINYFPIAGTDQVTYDKLMYDFSLAYLRIKPENYITIYHEVYFSLEDMEKLESEGGYFEGWYNKGNKFIIN